MLTQKSINLVPLTREFAIKHYSMPAMDGERELKASRVAIFTALLETGQFLSPVWSIAILRGTGQVYRADGQHTSCALTRIPDEYFPVARNIAYRVYEIDSIEIDGPTLFLQFDNNLSARQNVDYIGVFLARHPDIQNLSRKFTVETMAAVAYYLRDLGRRETDPTKRPVVHKTQDHGIYLENPTYRGFALWLNRWCGTRNAWLLRRPAVIAEVLSQWMRDPELATTFWDWYFTEGHHEADHETRLLSVALNKLHLNRAKAEDYRIAVKKHWNRFCRALKTEIKPTKSTKRRLPLRKVEAEPSLPFMPPMPPAGNRSPAKYR